MWTILGIFLLLLYILPTQCHIPSYVSTPPSRVEQHCELADTCVHDTIPICGRMGDEKRTFLDLCDLLEFACDTDQVFTHIEDEPNCPMEKKQR